MPMSSLRLEAIRDGIEDWELFRQLRQASNDSVADSFINKLVRNGSPGGHTLDPARLEAVRRGAARALIAVVFLSLCVFLCVFLSLCVL
jgi:hypothetical protein